MTKEEILEILDTLKEAYKRAITSGGVTTYSLNSSQGSTSVKQASMSELRAEIQYYTDLYNETVNQDSDSSSFTYIRGLGI